MNAWMNARIKLEVFYITKNEVSKMLGEPQVHGGWFWWTWFPGCEPNDPIGPFASYDEALTDAQNVTGIDRVPAKGGSIMHTKI